MAKPPQRENFFNLLGFFEKKSQTPFVNFSIPYKKNSTPLEKFLAAPLQQCVITYLVHVMIPDVEMYHVFEGQCRIFLRAAMSQKTHKMFPDFQKTVGDLKYCSIFKFKMSFISAIIMKMNPKSY